MRFARVTMAALLLGAAACAGEADDGVRIRSFDLESAEPPADARGGLAVVRPRANLHFRWDVDGDVRRMRLTANDKEVATFEGGELPRVASDLCSEAACFTSRPGEVEYRLTAWDANGHSDSRTLPVRVAEQGLQILAFTSSPESIEVGTSVELAWETAGAVATRVEAATVGGDGTMRELGSFEGAEARQGKLVDAGVRESTLYRLTARAEDGDEVTAEITVPLRTDAFITSITSSAEQVVAGEEFLLSWRTFGLERLTILRDDGGATIEAVDPHDVEAGSRALTITRDTTFSFVGVTVDGAVLTERCDETGCGPATLLVRVHPGPTVNSFTSDAAEIEVGADTMLRWNVSLADEVRIAWVDETGNHEQVFGPADQQMHVKPADTTRYTLVATGGGHTASRQLVLGVRPDAVIAGPHDVFPGEIFDVSWNTAGATRLELLVDGKRVDVTGLPVDAGSITLQADPSLVSGSTLQVLLIASDGETPPRDGQSSLEILVE